MFIYVCIPGIYMCIYACIEYMKECESVWYGHCTCVCICMLS